MDTLFNGDTPTPFLKKALALSGISHHQTLSSIIKQTQEKWLRPKGVERWELTPLFIGKEEAFRDLFEKAHLFDAVMPTKSCYRHALCLGTTYRYFKSRFDTLVTLVEQGVQVEEWSILTGRRPLDKNADCLLELAASEDTSFQTETDLATHLLSLEKTAKLMSLKYTLIDTPMRYNDGKWQRPTTRDTIEDWLSARPQKGACLVITSQPYAIYHNAVFRNCLPFPTEIACPETTWHELYHEFGALTIGVILDTLARTLWEIGVKNQPHF